ncbi:peptidoglycan-binding protein [Micropruina sp.]|uniref:peptidoglycan-binding protein n=1 Tax=Micropruina sp. TaxID=2737536 RepID=UPI0039E6286D
MADKTPAARLRRARVARWVVAVLLVVGVVTAAFWAGRVTMQPAATVSDAPAESVVVEVKEQTVGKVLNLNVTVSQGKSALAVNSLAGVVTSTGKSGSKKVGDVLYRVAAVPVRVVQGSQPFYRTLSYGMRGTDVAQLRNALVKMKYLSTKGRYFDSATYRAVRAWQKKLGLQQSGTVELGELVAVRRLPSPVLLDAKVLRLGAIFSGGEKVVFTAGKPSFALVVSSDQARLVPQDATVSMELQGKKWKAIISSSTTTENGETRLLLSSPSGGPVCGNNCNLEGAGEDIFVMSEVQVVPPATGPAVPVAALLTNPDGSTQVTVVSADGAGASRTVTVLGSQDGVAVVKGVTVGERVQVLAGGTQSMAPQAQPSPSR